MTGGQQGAGGHMLSSKSASLMMPGAPAMGSPAMGLVNAGLMADPLAAPLMGPGVPYFKPYIPGLTPSSSSPQVRLYCRGDSPNV